MMNVTSLKSAVMSSCSDRVLCDLACELQANTACGKMELYLFRTADIRSLKDFIQGGKEFRETKDILGIELAEFKKIASEICKWIESQISDRGKRQVNLCSLATFFPAISSLKSEIAHLLGFPQNADRRDAVTCVVNSVVLGEELRKCGVLDSVVVEIVCGSRFEYLPSEQTGDESGIIFEFSRESKLMTLCSSLEEVCGVLEGEGVKDFTVALELEPGDLFALNDLEALKFVYDYVKSRAILERHIGFNADIAHLGAANVKPNDLAQFSDRIVHAHVCDLPGMHTRDQAVGTWEAIHRIDSAIYGYLSVIAESYSKTKLKSTGVISLELEGCSQIKWIYDSLTSLQHCFSTLNSKHRRIRKAHGLPDFS